MPKMSEFTELDASSFNGATDYLVGYQSDDATATSNCRIAGNDYLTWIEANISHSDIASTPISTYLATMTFVGFDSADSANKEITFANLLTSLESTSGLDLKNMYYEGTTQILAGGQQAAITALTDSTGGTPSDTISGYTVSGVTDSTGGSTADAVLGACTDTTATDQSGTINDNFAKVAVCLNAIVSALNGDNDLSSVTAKINGLIQDMKDIGLMAS